MNPAHGKEKKSVGKTPPWLKWLLLVVLFASTAAGFFSRTLMVRHAAVGIPSLFNKIPSLFNKSSILQKSSEFGDFIVFRDKSGLTEIAIVCYGMGVGKDGLSRAVIDGKIVAPGAVVRGMKIIEISASNILVECSGKSLRLEPGERVTPEKTDESQRPSRQVKPSVPF